MAKQPKSSELSTDFTTTFGIIVRKDQEIIYNFYVHLLVPISQYVIRLLAAGTPRPMLDTSSLTTVSNPQTYQYFIRWLYHNDFTKPGDEACIDYPELLELYFLARYLEIGHLKNVVVDSLISKSVLNKQPIPGGWSQRIYRAISLDDQLRRLWVDFYVWLVDKDDLKELVDDLHPLFLKELAVALMTRSLGSNEFTKMRPPYET